MVKRSVKKKKTGANNNYLFTSESVTMGHPDKVADQVSDAVLDALIARDPFCRVACETLVTKDNPSDRIQRSYNWIRL